MEIAAAPLVNILVILVVFVGLLLLRKRAMRKRTPRPARVSDSAWADDAQAMFYMRTGRQSPTVEDLYGPRR